MSSGYYRSTSPGARRINNPARMSDSFNPDQYNYASRNAYASPRTSTERVIPISTQTYVNGRPLEKVYESHGRTRRSTVNDSQRPPIAVTTTHATSNRSRPTVIQATSARPSSPISRTKEERDTGYYSPSTTTAPRTHKKLYSVDDGKTKLVADIDMTKGRARRASVDRSGNTTARRTDADRSGGYTIADAHGRRSKEYHLSGPIRPKDSAYDEHSYSYTDPASMYKDTEPRWRPRRGSVDGSRERPQSMLVDPYARPAIKEPGPPPSSRALDRLNEGYGISRSHSSRQPVRSPHRPHEDAGYSSQDEYRVPRVRTNTLAVPGGEYVDQGRSPINRHSVAIVQDRPVARPEVTSTPRDLVPREKYYEDRREPVPRYEDRRERIDDRREPRPVDRPPTATRYQDASVERRGFGIRSGSQDRFGPQRSDESFDRPQYDARPPPPPEPRDYARREPPRPEPERRDYHAEDLSRKERERPRDEHVEIRRPERDDYRDDRDDFKDSHRHTRDRDHDQTRYRDYDREDRHDDHRRRAKDPYESGLGSMLPAAMGAAGLGAAALYGTNEILSHKNKDHDRGSVSPPESDDRERRRRDREPDIKQDLPPAPAQAPAAVAVPPPPPSSAPVERERDREREREPERGYVDDSGDVPDRASATLDAEEEYRRRLQQAQQEASRPRPEVMPGSFDRAPPPETIHEPEYHRRDDRRYEKQTSFDESPPPRQLRHQGSDEASYSADSAGADSVLDRSLFNGQAEIIDNSASNKRENRVRIVEPPNEKESVDRPRGILKAPTKVFPEDPNPIREGVAPLKDAKNKGIPPGARWTKIRRSLVNPEALIEAKERFEERQDFVIVLRVLSKEEIQKLAEKTRVIRDARYDPELAERRERRKRDKEAKRARRDADEYEDDSEDEFIDKPPRMLEAGPSSSSATASLPGMTGSSVPGASGPEGDVADFVRADRDRRRDRDREREREMVPREERRDRDRDRDRERERERDRGDRDRDRDRADRDRERDRGDRGDRDRDRDRDDRYADRDRL